MNTYFGMNGKRITRLGRFTKHIVKAAQALFCGQYRYSSLDTKTLLLEIHYPQNKTVTFTGKAAVAFYCDSINYLHEAMSSVSA